MRIASLGDIHITHGIRLRDHEATLNAIVDDIIAAQPDLVTLGGDYYGTTVPWPSHPAERAVLFPAIVRLANVAPVISLPGNHDFVQNVEVFESLGGAWPVRVISGAGAIEVGTAAGIVHVYGIAYPSKKWLLSREGAPRGLVESQTLAEETLASLIRTWGQRILSRRATHPDEPHVLLAHAMVEGARVAGGEILASQEIALRRFDLDGLPVDIGLLSHIHMFQEVAHRCAFISSTWRNDFGEASDPKGWVLTLVGDDAPTVATAENAFAYPAIPGERLAVHFEHRPSACRSMVTLTYRWASHADEEIARWLNRPTDEEIAACAGAEVRMRLTAPETWVSSIPWSEEVARVTAAGAHRIQEERRIEPALRTRAPEVATATEPMAKLSAFWGTLATPPTQGEQAAAELVLHELQELDDDGVRLATEEALASA